MSAPTFALSLHADWRCGRSGACCTAGWPIPVEPEVAAGLRAGLASQRLSPPAGRDEARLLPRPAGLADGSAALLGHDAQGACLFFDHGCGRACAIHRDLGHEALPVACRLFPRVCVLEPHGVSVTLSHFCPTAAARLFDEQAPLTIVADPSAFPRGALYEGLDARRALPPLLRPDALLGWQGQRAFERHAVVALADERGPVEETLLRLAARVERARAWRVELGPLDGWLTSALAGPVDAGAAPGWARRQPRELLAPVFASLVHPAGELAGLNAGEGHEQGRLAGHWPEFEQPLRRFLAAHAFASWVAHQGRGLRTRVLALLTALALVRARAGQLCGRAGVELDAALFLRAVRDADLLLRHLCAPEELARRLSAAEEQPA